MEEEDWNTSANTTTKTATPNQQSNNSTTDNTQQTLKITDGYKYSYEALASPANVEDWIDPPSYSSSKRIPNGFSQNSFRDSNSKSYHRPERNDSYKRFDKRNNSYSNPSGDFAAPKSSRFSRPLPNVNPTDWDAPVNNPSTPMNGSFNVNVPLTNTASDAWDALGGGTPHSVTNHKSTPMASFNKPGSNIEDDDWDGPSGLSTKPPADLPPYRPSSAASVSMHSLHSEPLNVASSQPISNDDEENWDEPGTPKSSSQVVMPTFRPSSSANTPLQQEDWDAGPSTANTDNGFSNTPSYPSDNADLYSSSRGHDSSWQSNKYSRSRNYESNDHFSRDPYSRHSRGNFRNNSYDRGNRGSRGSRGSRGGRGGRDFNSSFNSRSRHDRSYPAPVSFNNTVVATEEDWDTPSGFANEPSENSAPPPQAPPPVLPSQPVPKDESWD